MGRPLAASRRRGTQASHGREKNVDCIEVLGQLADFLDEDAREELCRDIKAHLTQCRDCQLQVDTIKKTIVLYQAESGKTFELPVRVTQPQRRGRPVVAPYSSPASRSRAASASGISLGNGPCPTRVV